MSLAEPMCSVRRCKHFLGVTFDEPGVEINERNFCTAFPNGIPDDIAYGENEHWVPTKKQKNNIVYEQEES